MMGKPSKKELELDVWDFLSLLEARNRCLNVTMEDWLDSEKV